MPPPPWVSAQGLGCLGMSEWYGPTDADELAVLDPLAGQVTGARY